MCNTCNTNRNTCGCQNNCCCNGNNLFNLLFGTTQQLMCRDCCGNVRTSCGCFNNGCGCSRSCCCGNASTTNGNANFANNGMMHGNGGFACFTVCGNNTNATTAQTTAWNGNTDWYYARQYGMYQRGDGGCHCGGSNSCNAF